MCLFWWNTDIYLCGTSKTIASFSTVNWINAPSGCWAMSRAENCIFCYAAAVDGRIWLAFICSAFTFPVRSQAYCRKPTQTTKKPELGWVFFPSTNPPLVSLRALILVVLCPSANCRGGYHAPMQNPDPTCNSSQQSELFLPLGFSPRSSLLTQHQTVLHSLVRPHTEQAIW